MEPCCAVYFLGRTPRCTTPSVDVQSVPRFTLIDYHGRQAYQKKTHQRLLFWEVSVVQQCPSVVASLQIAALREPVPELIAEITLPGITPPVIAQA